LNTSSTTKARSLRLAVCLTLAGCGFGESGIAPPTDRVFFPAGIAIDPSGDWLYVVNSNSDLRFNAGTVVAVNLAQAGEDRALFQQKPARYRPRPDAEPAPIATCANSVFVEPQGGDPNFCCRDFLDPSILNCDDRRHVEKSATVRIGSFGGSIVAQKFERAGKTTSRLFVSVRAEPSLTFIDASPTPAMGSTPASISMNCATGNPGGNAYCTDDFRIKSMKVVGAPDRPFPEEPHSMVLDDVLGVLYVGHLGGVDRGQLVARGVSVIDVCNPADANQPPHLASILDNAFPQSGAIGVSALTQSRPGDATASLLATAQLTTEVTEILFADPKHADPKLCAQPERNLQLVAGSRFASSAYGTRGGDLRGVVLSDDAQRAYVLHRQYAVRGEYNPPSVVAIDRSENQGFAENRPIATVEVCSGPNRLLRHDAGRGTRLFVNCFENGEIYVIEPDLMNIEAVIELGAGPADLVFAPGERSVVAYVAGFANNNVSVLDLRPGSPTEYRVVQRIGFARPTAVPK
jgi:DNA-binding beta-propeller fold protein YncE